MTERLQYMFSGSWRKLTVGVIFSGVVALPSMARAGTVTATVSYYTLSPSDPDANQNIDGLVTNEVRPTLGPDGLPVLNSGPGCTAPCYANGGSVNTIHDVNGANEITYWSPIYNSNVSYEGSTAVTLPYDDPTLFPPEGNGSSDANGLQTAVISTVLTVPTTETVSFTVGADDDAFVYLNNQLVCDLGGVHPNASTGCSSMVMAPGSYALNVFYADLHAVAASLDFAVDTANVTGSPVPEPPSVLLLATALLGAAVLRLRSRFGLRAY